MRKSGSKIGNIWFWSYIYGAFRTRRWYILPPSGEPQHVYWLAESNGTISMSIRVVDSELWCFEVCENLYNPVFHFSKQLHMLVFWYTFSDMLPFKKRKTCLQLIFERKSLADLISSIKDGRYIEQSFRLSECSLDNHNIYYIIFRRKSSID